jgi:hypothetical protein
MISWGLVGMVWVGLGLVDMLHGLQQCEECVHVFAIGGMPVSIGHFWLQV